MKELTSKDVEKTLKTGRYLVLRDGDSADVTFLTRVFEIEEGEKDLVGRVQRFRGRQAKVDHEKTSRILVIPIVLLRAMDETMRARGIKWENIRGTTWHIARSNGNWTAEIIVKEGETAEEKSELAEAEAVLDQVKEEMGDDIFPAEAAVYLAMRLNIHEDVAKRLVDDLKEKGYKFKTEDEEAETETDEDKILKYLKKKGKAVSIITVGRNTGLGMSDLRRAIDLLKSEGKIKSPKEGYIELA